jgi:hypothetical protein
MLTVNNHMRDILTDAVGNKFKRTGPEEWAYIGEEPMRVEQVKERPPQAKFNSGECK